MERQMNDPEPDIDPRIGALADGSLPGPEHNAVAAEVQSSAMLRAQLREQERAVALVHATEEISAPASLRASINELTAPPAGRSAPRRRRWRGPRIFLPIATGLAVAIAAVVIALQGSPAPTVPQTAHLALAAATAPSPARDPHDEDHLITHVGSVRFPSYQSLNGWRVSGMRRDTIHGRAVTTVFYRAPTGARVGYAVVSGPKLAAPSGRKLNTHGVHYVFSRVGSAHLISWWQGGHTCLIAGRSVSDHGLLALAAAEHRA